MGTRLGTNPPGSPWGLGGGGLARCSARGGALALQPLGSGPFPRHVNLCFMLKKRENMIKIQMSLKASLLL